LSLSAESQRRGQRPRSAVALEKERTYIQVSESHKRFLAERPIRLIFPQARREAEFQVGYLPTT